MCCMAHSSKCKGNLGSTAVSSGHADACDWMAGDRTDQIGGHGEESTLINNCSVNLIAGGNQSRFHLFIVFDSSSALTALQKL